MQIHTWKDYIKTYETICKINNIIMTGDSFNIYRKDGITRKNWFELRYIIGDFDRYPEWDQYKSIYGGLSITARKAYPRLYLKGLLAIFKYLSYSTNNDIDFNPDGLPF